MTDSSPVDAHARRPLTASEQLIWLGQRLDSDAPLYNMALAITIEARLDPEVLAKALARVVRGSDALRTIVLEAGGAPECIVLRDVDLPVDSVEVPDADWTEEGLRLLTEERARRRFPLDQPMTDVALFRGSERSVLFINQHHLVTDATSTGILYRRLSEEYRAVLEGTPGGPADWPQYEVFARGLSDRRESLEYARALEHWADPKWVGAPDLHMYGIRSARRGRTERTRVSLGTERTAALHELVRRPEFRALSEGHSRFLVFATVLSAWTARATDRDRVVIGVPSHNRTTADFRDTLGLFIELFPLRVELNDESTFASLAKEVGAATIDMMRYGVAGSSAAAGTRGYEVTLNYITAELGDFAGAGGTADWVHTGFGDPAHAVRVQVHDFDGSGVPTLDFDLDCSVFGERERDWMVEHYFALFDALVSDADLRVASVRLVGEEEASSFAPIGPSVAGSPGVLESFARWVERCPDDVAVIVGEESWTFEQVARQAASVRVHLARDHGIGPGDVVGILLERGVEQVAAILGVLGTGAAYMPMDPTHPEARIRYQMRDSGTAVVIVQGDLPDPGSDWGVPTFSMDGLSMDESAELDAWEYSPESLAYVLYTSGSTGQPKGVEIEHGALAEYLGWASRTYDRGARLAWPWFTSSAYDLSVTSILTPLMCGGSIVAYLGRGDSDGLLVRDVFTEDRVDAVKLTPSHLALLRDLDLTRSRVRCLVVGGENLRTEVARRMGEGMAPGTEIFNEYGPTEATVACMIHRFDPELDQAESVPIGVPADNMRISVRAPGGAPALRGETGEIHIAGPRLARGYRGRQDLTDASFVPHPGHPGERMYRTGDLGRWNAAGVLEFRGRDDDQVKVGGVRLELGEVEAAIARHPQVSAAAALLVDAGHRHGDRRCKECGLEAGHPEARIDDAGVCQLCRRFRGEEGEVARYFGSLDDLQKLLADARERAEGPHDCIMLYSGGKDSTYALCRIVEMGANPLVFLLDNGFISEQAKENARRVADLLGLEIVIGETPEMPGIFAESLSRFSNVCQGCFKTVYTLALNLAIERGIGAIVTGLSRGQIFEARLADLYRRRIYDPEEVDRTIDEARREYHRMDDAVAGLLDAGPLSVDDVLDQVTFIDFYRYTSVELDDVLSYLRQRTPWIRPSDTGRSTNCLINEAGIFVHLAERGFHNYSLPYSWDVRLGHKQRDAAVDELDDDLDPANVRRMLDEVGYRERHSEASEARLVAYYVAEADIPASELRKASSERLPAGALPSAFVRLDAMPLTENGKVDRAALPVPGAERPAVGVPFVEPTTPEQWLLSEIWAEVLGIDSVGIHDDFFELGGESMRCIQIASVARERGLAFRPRDLFSSPTIAELSLIVAGEGVSEPHFASAEVSAEELDDLAAEFGD